MPTMMAATLLLATLGEGASEGASTPEAGAASLLHTAFSAECTFQFDWFAVGLFYSHKISQQPGPITRLLACSPEQLATYRGLSIGPTFVHPNLRDHPLVDEKDYPSYNKPGSILFWLNSAQAPSERFLLFVDADMLIRAPLDPLALGAARGRVVSAEYAYLVGTASGFAQRFIRPELAHRQAQVGGFHVMHREDARRVAPRWLALTKAVRAFASAEPALFERESMHVAEAEASSAEMLRVRHKQARWHSEMYGYVFSAAEQGLQHAVSRWAMLYPGYLPHLNRLPAILHYGSDYRIGAASELLDVRPPEGQPLPAGDFYFNKMSHVSFDVTGCPSELPFGSPPALHLPPASAGGPPGPLRSRRDLLCVEHVLTLNAALCGYLRAHCSEDGAAGPGGGAGWPRLCREQSAAQQAELVLAARRAQAQSCADSHADCRTWAAKGECARNLGFMASACAVACGTCAGLPPALGAVEAAELAALGRWEPEEGFALPEEGAPLEEGSELGAMLRGVGLSLQQLGLPLHPPLLRAAAAGDAAEGGGGAGAAGAEAAEAAHRALRPAAALPPAEWPWLRSREPTLGLLAVGALLLLPLLLLLWRLLRRPARGGKRQMSRRWGSSLPLHSRVQPQPSDAGDKSV